MLFSPIGFFVLNHLITISLISNKWVYKSSNIAAQDPSIDQFKARLVGN
jgi:hypothetical protein